MQSVDKARDPAVAGTSCVSSGVVPREDYKPDGAITCRVHASGRAGAWVPEARSCTAESAPQADVVITVFLATGSPIY